MSNLHQLICPSGKACGWSQAPGSILDSWGLKSQMSGLELHQDQKRLPVLKCVDWRLPTATQMVLQRCLWRVVPGRPKTQTACGKLCGLLQKITQLEGSEGFKWFLDYCNGWTSTLWLKKGQERWPTNIQYWNTHLRFGVKLPPE